MNAGTLWRNLTVFGLCLGLTACSVQGTEHEVSIDHPADKIAIAEWAAERHCEQFDRTAQHVQSEPIKSNSSALFIQIRTSTFECVAR